MQRSSGSTYLLNEFSVIKIIRFILIILFVISFKVFCQPNDTDDTIHKIKMFLNDVCLSTDVTEGVIAILPIKLEPYQILHETPTNIEFINHEGRQFIITEKISLQTVKIIYNNNIIIDFSNFFSNLNGRLVLLKLDVDSIAIDTFRIQAKSDTIFAMETITNEIMNTPTWWDNEKYLNVPFLSSLAVTVASGTWYLIKRSQVNDLRSKLENAPNIEYYNNLLGDYNLKKNERNIALTITVISGIIFVINLIKDTFFRHSETVEIGRQKENHYHSNSDNTFTPYNNRFEFIPTVEKGRIGISLRF